MKKLFVIVLSMMLVGCSASTTNAKSTSNPIASIITNNKPSTSPTTRQVTFIGDSVMLWAAIALQDKFPESVIDAKESRQVVQAESIVEDLKSHDELYDTVVIALGTNSPFNSSVGDELIATIGKDKQVYWVTAYGKHLDWQDDTNYAINLVADKNSNVHIIDWASEAKNHDDWFYQDGIHLNADGQKAYASFMEESLG